VAGYVAGFPIPEVLQGINAFTLGMRSVNPKAEVKVVWLNVWFDPPQGARRRHGAVQPGRRCGEPSTPAPRRSWRQRKSAASWPMAYHSDMRRVGPDAQIVAVTHQWGDYYTARAQSRAERHLEAAAQVWGGVKEGMIRVGDFGSKVPQGSAAGGAQRARRTSPAGKLQPFHAAGRRARQRRARGDRQGADAQR
jgi:basic membrane protein A